MYYFYEGRTVRGVGHVGWALLVILVTVVIIGTTTALIGFLYGALLQAPVNFVGTLVSVLAAICLAFVGEVASAILFLVGFYEIHAGRHEYGLEQSHAAERALVFLIVYVVLSAVSVVYSPAFSLFLGVVNPSALPVLAVSLVLNPVIALFAGLTLEHAVRTVAAPLVRSRLRTALVLGIVGAAVGPGLTLLANASRPATVESVSGGIIAAAVAGEGLAALSLLLFWLAYREVRQALEAGSPGPVLPRVEQIYPWLYRPWVPYPPQPPGSPPQPPPSG